MLEMFFLYTRVHKTQRCQNNGELQIHLAKTTLKACGSIIQYLSSIHLINYLINLLNHKNDNRCRFTNKDIKYQANLPLNGSGSQIYTELYINFVRFFSP